MPRRAEHIYHGPRRTATTPRAADPSKLPTATVYYFSLPLSLLLSFVRILLDFFYPQRAFFTVRHARFSRLRPSLISLDRATPFALIFIHPIWPFNHIRATEETADGWPDFFFDFAHVGGMYDRLRFSSMSRR